MTVNQPINSGKNTCSHPSQAFDDAQLQTILAVSPAVIYMCRPDGDYGATFISENVRVQLGYEPSEFTGNSGFWASRIHPEDRSGVFEHLPALFRTGQHIHEYRFLHKDGTYRWMHDELRLVKDQDGAFVGIVGSWMDISDRRAMEEDLRKSNIRFEDAQRIAHLGSWEWDIVSGEISWSDEVFRIFGFDAQTFIPTYDFFLAVIPPEDRGQVDEAVQRAVRERVPYGIDHRIVLPDGNIRYVYEQGTVTYGEGGEAVRMVGTVLDISDRKQVEVELKKKKGQLKHLAYYDPLTGLPNRNLFHDRLNRAIDRANRNKSQVALLFIDLDLFKKYNDTLGHQVGDQLLREVARRLQAMLRSVDTIARLGGDEFVVVVEDVSVIEQVAHIAQKILNESELPISIGEHLCYVSASIGISLYSSGVYEVDTLLKHADIAMYAAKKRGRNNFQFYSPEMDARAHELLLLENDLRLALEKGQLVLHYQPQVDLLSGRIVGLEALVRWLHPTKGMVPPDDFIPLAEESGLIVPIGTWVLRTACAYAQALRKEGISPFRMSVNISMHQFKAQDFPELVAGILDETGLESHWLELEITESIAMANAQETISHLDILKGVGVRVAIDDFGKGHSSLSHLKHLPITTLKIDRGFVTDILTSQYDVAIVEAIQALARSLDLDVLVEGIETQEQKQLLCRLGCTLGQGYLFSRPLPPDDLILLCRLQNPFGHLL